MSVNTLREAMGRVQLQENDEELQRPTVEDLLENEMGQAVAVINDETAMRRKKAEEEAERQRCLDAALADAIEVVARHRIRLGRRVCSRPDGTVVRQIHELLKSMSSEGGSDNDPSFSSGQLNGNS